jgi:methionyl-tRNA formyltransferase
MRILFAGTPQVAVPSLHALLESPHEVVGVVTRQDAPAGRGRTLTPSPVKVAAETASLPVITAKPSDPEFARQIAELTPDIAAVVAYGHILEPETLELAPKGWLNLHFSILPRWRGAAPVQRALMSGDKTTGACVFQIDEGMDTGPVFATQNEPIRADDTAGTLLERLSHSGAGLLAKVFDLVEQGKVIAIPQYGTPTKAAKLTPQEAKVDWSAPAVEIANLIRGCTPEPGAWTELTPGQRLGLGPIKVLEAASGLAPGELLVSKNAVQVGTGSVDVELGQVQPVGKKTMPAASWARGARLPEVGRFQ